MAIFGIAAAVAFAALAALAVTWTVYRRPQRGLLLLAALVPLHGVLVLLPLPGLASAWKEGLLRVMASSLVMPTAFARNCRSRSTSDTAAVGTDSASAAICTMRS